MKIMRSSIFDRLSFLSLFLVIVLLPLFFLPFTSIPVETSKGLLLVVGLVLSLIFWSLARFSDGKILLPRSASLAAGVGVVIITFLSALFSSSSQVSFFGTMFDIGSFWFIFAGFLLMLMSSIIFRNRKSAKIVLFGTIVSSAIVLVFQSAHLFIPQVLSFGVLAGKTDNILGSWNALGLFAGFSGIVSLLAVEFFSISRITKLVLRALVLFSMIFVAVVNFSLVWEIIGILSLIIFVYKISITYKESKENVNEDWGDAAGDYKIKNTHFPIFPFILIILSLLFIMSGAFIGGILPNRLGIQNSEIGPSFSSTILVTKSVIKNKPIFGIGPNKFSTAWAMYKPIAINATQFWDASFDSGSGLLLTLVSTTGVLGILAWLFFFILLIFGGIKSIFSRIKNSAKPEIMIFFVLALYLFASSFFYATGAVIFLLALAFSGVFVGLSASSSSNDSISLSFLTDYRKSFFSILFLLVLILISAATAFKYLERVASIPYFGKTLTAQTIPDAESSISKALTLYTNDLYLRTYAQVYIVKFNSIAQAGASLSDSDKSLLQASLDQAVNGAEGATLYNPANYLNFQALGSLYQTAGAFGVKDAYSKAIEAYKMASALNPLNPGLKFDIASAYNALLNTREAKNYANEALTLKPDYVNALVLLSQIAKNEGDTSTALSYAQTALSISPGDKNLVQYVESLKNGTSTPTPPPTTTPNKSKK